MLSDRFDAVEPLGVSAAGAIYRALDPRRGRPVALRVLPAGPYRTPRAEHRCLRRVLDAFEIESGRWVLVEEPVEGEGLDEVLERAGTIPVAERARWIACLAAALVAAHEVGEEHGALSAAWITISPSGGPSLAGLGAGRLLGHGDLDPAADAFALGALAYELLTGRPPFGGRSAAEALALPAEERATPEPLALLAPETPAPVAAAVELALDPVPEVRRRGLARLALLAGPEDGAGAGSDRSFAPPAPEPPPLHDENVRFTVYRPRAVPSETWSRLLFFAHLDALPGDAEDDEEDPVDRVEAVARRELGAEVAAYRESAQDSLAALPREGEVTATPEMAGVRFSPPSVTFLWIDSVHWHEFRLRPEGRLRGSTARGRLVVRHGALLLAEIPLSIAVDRPEAVEASPAPAVRESARAYRAIFPSYSHRDTPIVEQAEAFAEAVGDRYLRDVLALRSGEVWNDRLLELIGEADVFQLFWSSHAMRSPYVEQEWRHALGLGRPNFVRPTYWEKPLPSDAGRGLPPEELRKLHFHFLGAAAEEAPEPALEIREPRSPQSSPGPWAASGGARSAPEPASTPARRPRFAAWATAAGVVVMAGLAYLVLPRTVETPGSVDLSSEGEAVGMDDGTTDTADPFELTLAALVIAPGGEPEAMTLSSEEVARILEWVETSPESVVVIAGHAAGEGRSEEESRALSEERAAAVREQLVTLGVPEERLRIETYGDERPLCAEESEACRQANERVEVVARSPTPLLDTAYEERVEELRRRVDGMVEAREAEGVRVRPDASRLHFEPSGEAVREDPRAAESPPP